MQIPNRRRIARNYDVLSAVASVDIIASLANASPLIYAPNSHNWQLSSQAGNLQYAWPISAGSQYNQLHQAGLHSGTVEWAVQPKYFYQGAPIQQGPCMMTVPGDPLNPGWIPEPNILSTTLPQGNLAGDFDEVATLRRLIAGALDYKGIVMPKHFEDFLYGNLQGDPALTHAQKMVRNNLSALIDYFLVAEGVGIAPVKRYVFRPDKFYLWLFTKDVPIACPSPNAMIDYAAIQLARSEALDVCESCIILPPQAPGPTHAPGLLL